jgi:predicted CopG family antitoxin
MSTADKRIPVTEDRWKELNNLKEPGQSYDELLEILVEEHKKAQLMKHVEELREEQEEFTSLDEV